MSGRAGFGGGFVAPVSAMAVATTTSAPPTIAAGRYGNARRARNTSARRSSAGTNGAGRASPRRSDADDDASDASDASDGGSGSDTDDGSTSARAVGSDAVGTSM